MSRELNRKQEKMILSEIQRNKVLGLENPYKISTDIYFKCMKINDHETFHQNFDNFIYDFRRNDNDTYFLGKWESVSFRKYSENSRRKNSEKI